MMNELEYDQKREIVSLIVFQCVKIRVYDSILGTTAELFNDVRQDLWYTSDGLIVMYSFFLLLASPACVFVLFQK